MSPDAHMTARYATLAMIVGGLVIWAAHTPRQATAPQATAPVTYSQPEPLVALQARQALRMLADASPVPAADEVRVTSCSDGRCVDTIGKPGQPVRVITMPPQGYVPQPDVRIQIDHRQH